MSQQTEDDSAATAAPDPVEPVHEHVVAIRDLAQAFDVPVPMVADMYWSELARLKEGATPVLYLPLLTARRVRDRLRRIQRRDNIRNTTVSHATV